MTCPDSQTSQEMIQRQNSTLVQINTHTGSQHRAINTPSPGISVSPQVIECLNDLQTLTLALKTVYVWDSFLKEWFYKVYHQPSHESQETKNRFHLL